MRSSPRLIIRSCWSARNRFCFRSMPRAWVVNGVAATAATTSLTSATITNSKATSRLFLDFARTSQPARGGTMSPREGNAKGQNVTLHVVSSLDGFIAKKDNSVSWLDGGSVYEAGVSISEEEAATFVKAIDCYVLGSRTYEHALELGWPYGDTPTVVVSGREWPAARESVEFYSGDLKTLLDVKLAPRYRNIWLVGGAILCQRFLELGLVDEIRLTIAPVLLGEGLRLFGGSLTEERWNLKNVVAYKNGC